MPRGKYPAQARFEDFAPAPLDEVSLWNGVAKFDHHQYSITDSEAKYAIAYLESLFPMMSTNSDQLSTEQIRLLCTDPDHAAKTSGFPWNSMGYPTKGACVDALGVEQLLEYFSKYSSVTGATLKAEIRPVGKDARLFRPCDLSSFCEAALLFSRQNDYILNSIHACPVFAKYVTPGDDIPRVYREMRAFDGSCFSADGAQWDAHFAVSVAAVIATWRSQYADEKRVHRYYRQMYNGYTNAGGHLMHMPGQPSGHFNTTTDNSLGHCVMFAIHAYRNKLSIPMFSSNVLYRCCGDDLLWSDRTGLFYPEALSDTYSSLGMYLEFDSLEPQNVYDLPFVGVQFHDRDVRGVVRKMYAIRGQRAKANFSLRKTSNTDIDELQKYSSLCQLTYGDEATYKALKSATEMFVTSAQLRGTLSLTDPFVRGTLAAMQPARLELAYFGFERVFSPEVVGCARL